MPKFNKGDKVRRIITNNTDMKIGTVWTVEGYADDNNGLYLKDYRHGWCMPCYFELVEEKKKTYMFIGDPDVFWFTDLGTALESAGGRDVFEVVAVHEQETSYVRREL